MDPGEAADVAIFVVCVTAFILYNVLYYFSSTVSRLLPSTIPSPLHSAENLWRTGNKARSIWAEKMMHSASEALLAVHTVRNLLISVAWFAAADSALIVRFESIVSLSLSLSDRLTVVPWLFLGSNHADAGGDAEYFDKPCEHCAD